MAYKIILDPGLGFGKNVEQNIEILSRLNELKDMGPILLGASKKRFIGKLLNDLPFDERVEGTVATTVIGIEKGVDIVRVHNVLENKRACLVADGVYRKRGEICMEQEKQRTIQEYVPGKQVTLAHLIANPDKDMCIKLGLDEEKTNAIGILTITPGEAAIISADIAIKSGSIELGFLDRFSGTLLLTGDFASVESSLKAVLAFLQETLKFYICEITRS